MARKLAIILAITMLAFVVWGLFFENNATTIVINGEQVTLLLFVFAGLGLIVLGGFILGGVVLTGFAFPFLLPLLVPLAVVWAFIALVRHKT